MTSEKTLPADIEAERATLGSILLNREAIIAVAPWLKPEHCYLEKHAWIYTAMLACYSRREPPDTRLVSAELRRAGRLDPVGGIPYLSELVDAVPTSYHIEYYARIVERTALLRALIVAGGRIAAIGYDEQGELDQAIGDAYRVLDEATARSADERALMPIARIVEERYMALQSAAERDEEPQFGLATGLRDYDEMTGGLHKSNLVVLAARPSVGKSSLALCIAKNVAESGRRVDIFSLEMSRMQCLDRLIAHRTGANLMDIRQMRLSERGLATYYDALGWAHALRIAFDETPALTLTDMRARLLRRAAHEGPPALVIVDYLGLMRAPKAKNRYEEVSEIARGLKNLAKELDVPVLALSQLSRAVEGRTSHVPMLSDLRESGEIEQAADQVVFIYRDELYDTETDRKGIAELHIAKHRDGPIGVVSLRFEASTTRFETLSYRRPDAYVAAFDPALAHFREAA
jgi:replicative DNA helicase